MTGLVRLIPAALAASLLAAAADARADVRLEGDWSPPPPTVSLSLQDTPRSEAVRALASAAKWNLLLTAGPEDKVTLELSDAPADEVLRALLAEGAWVAERRGSIITIRPDAPAAPSAAPSAAPAGPAVKPRDVNVLANSLRIGRDDTVRNVTVMGGSVEIEGRVTGNLTVYGGSARLYGSGRIEGNAHLTGGSMRIDEGGSIDGDLEVLGGSIEGADKAKIGGNVTLDPGEGEGKASFATRAGHKISAGVRLAAFLFILGVLFITLGGQRAEQVRVAIAEKPMRSVALGLVGVLGTLGALALCALTLIGIPVAVVGAVAALALAFGGTTSGLAVLGATIAGHKSKNVYVHLAVGCAVFVALGVIPGLGPLAQIATVLAGIGGVVSTRALGLWRPRAKPPAVHPYR